MRYVIKLPNANNHLINISLHVDNIDTDELELQLPAWRPGRYEIGNFAKNIQSFKVKDSGNRIVEFIKITKDKWKINTLNLSSIIVEYDFYAYELNAGSCYFTNDQLYINGIQCFLYNAHKLHQKHIIELNIPVGYKIACSLMQEGNLLYANDFHELVDSPLIASATLHHREYQVGNTKFHIWVQGDIDLDWERVINDFKRFSTYQIKIMGTLPVKEFCFLVQAPNQVAYHGVEHLANTVLYFGPAANIMEEKYYTEFLGLASHELFHSWNIKAIRPVEWFPYNYEKENYSRLGYVAEGVTTYLGDKFLYSSGVFNTEQYLKELNSRLQSHIDNFGRFYMPVTRASIDTWLDGYVLGVPHRKTSIYTEGALITLMLDLMIMKNSGYANSIESVMKSM
ncbi:MAG: M61 family peptidase, partial [Bacteroidia bacterium]|nr:M61 family peptidase [Bacteroidia bacterium]